MAMSEELTRLEELHQRGSLTNEEFSRAKARLLDGSLPKADSTPMAKINAFKRSNSDKWIAGVCGGIARSTGIKSWIWRLLFTVLFLCGGAGIVLYVLLWVFVPCE